MLKRPQAQTRQTKRNLAFGRETRRYDGSGTPEAFRIARWGSPAVIALVGAAPALAHPGEHGRMSTLELLHHIAEPFHLALILATGAIVGGLIWGGGRLSAVRAKRWTYNHKDRQS